MLGEDWEKPDGSHGSDSATAVAEWADIDELLTDCLERLLLQAPLADISNLRNFLPNTDELSRQFVLVELIKVDMSAAVESAPVRRIQSY